MDQKVMFMLLALNQVGEPEMAMLDTWSLEQISDAAFSLCGRIEHELEQRSHTPTQRKEIFKWN